MLTTFRALRSPSVLQPLPTFVGVWLPVLSLLYGKELRKGSVRMSCGEALWEWAVGSLLEICCPSSQQSHLSAFKLKPWARVPVLPACLCQAMDLTHPDPDLLAWPQKADTGWNLLDLWPSQMETRRQWLLSVLHLWCLKDDKNTSLLEWKFISRIIEKSCI